MANRILRINEVKTATGLSRSTLYALARSGDFPVPIQLTARCIGWNQSEIEDWLEARRAQGYTPRPFLTPEAVVRGVQTRRQRIAANRREVA